MTNKKKSSLFMVAAIFLGATIYKIAATANVKPVDLIKSTWQKKK